MPGSMRDQFAHFYMPDEEAIAVAMKTGLVVPDTNVVLNLYRFQATARDELFGALEKLGDRLWIPHQVALEFHRNRLGVMKEQEEYFAKTRDEVLGAVNGLHGKVRAFGNRLGLSAGQTKKIDDVITELNGVVADVVLEAEGLNEVWLARHAADTILARIDILFDSRVGMAMEAGEFADARKEAERRVRDKVPPGYKDRNKEDPAGDYLVWCQTMTEAASRSLPVVFITDDSRSDDWYRRERGLTLGARHELREEMNRVAGVPLLMMTTGTFLHHAETYLEAEVSDETITQAQAQELNGSDKVRHEARRAWLLRAAAALREKVEDPAFGASLIEGFESGDVVEQVIALGLQLTEDGTAIDNLPPETAGRAEAVVQMLNDITENLQQGKIAKKEALWVLSVIRDELVNDQGSPDEPPSAED